MEANEHIQKIFDERKDFIIIATTGKNMSRVTDVCKLLVGNQLPDHATQPSDTKEFEDSEIREFKVVYRYLHHNWRPFIEINVTSVILSYLLETDIDQMYQKEIGPDNQKLYDLLEQSFSNKNVMEKGIRERVININKSLKFKEDTEEDYKTEILNKCDEIIDEIYNSQDKITYLHNLIKETDYRDKTAELQIKYFCIYFGVLPEMNAYLEDILRESGTYTQIFQDYGNNIRAYGRALYSDDCTIRAENIFSIPERIKYCFKLLRRYENNMKQIMQNDTSYKVLENDPSNNGESKKETKVYVVINNLKNIFEAYYFRCRYSSFYLVSIACDEKMRQENFNNNTTYLLTELKENLSYGKKVFRRVDQYITENRLVGEKVFDKSRKYNDAKSELKSVIFNEAEFLFMQQIYNEGSGLRKNCYKHNLANIILQDVTTCIENADIFLTRNLKEREYQCDYGLIRPLARMVTLMMHPGLLTPTKIERCMQVAMTAKLNSGCLSRQVGAVVTDSNYNILSLGWNDTPCGVESCIRRNMYDLIRNHDSNAYSEYELYDIEFRKYIGEIGAVAGGDDVKAGLQGLPYAFCFKDIYQDMIHQRDQIYTKSLHGEERALAACGSEKLKGGYLFTTSSPCELCAKKAKEGEIKKIYYIEQYPGISRTHILNSGSRKSWAEYIPFVGAIGLAYTKLYTPIMPYKDEVKALGYAPVDFYHKSLEEDEKPKGKKEERREESLSVDISQQQEVQETQK